MKGKEELIKFIKMWTWLMAHPAHDREYYIQHLEKSNEVWDNSCPLSNSKYAEKCNGCKLLWDSQEGTLCTDPSAPVYKWNNTERHQPGKRTTYASQVVILAMMTKRQLERQVKRYIVRRKVA